MKILLIEDDEREWEIYKRIIKQKTDTEIVACTKSSTEAISLLQKHNPDAVILDLELTDGEGSGIEFLQSYRKLHIDKYSQMIVTTNIYSDTVYNYLHNEKVDFIFCKNQERYSQENVINTICLLAKNDRRKSSDSQQDIASNDEESKIAKIINKELDLIGVSTHLKGRKYLFDAIEYVINNMDNYESISVIQYLVGKYKRASSTISRAMQNAILHAWRISSIEDLTTLYTARINYETGVPTPTEFIYYYAEKARKSI